MMQICSYNKEGFQSPVRGSDMFFPGFSGIYITIFNRFQPGRGLSGAFYRWFSVSGHPQTAQNTLDKLIRGSDRTLKYGPLEDAYLFPNQPERDATSLVAGPPGGLVRGRKIIFFGRDMEGISAAYKGRMDDSIVQQWGAKTLIKV